MFDCDADPLGLAVADDWDALALALADAEALELLELLELEFEHPASAATAAVRHVADISTVAFFDFTNMFPPG